MVIRAEGSVRAFRGGCPMSMIHVSSRILSMAIHQTTPDESRPRTHPEAGVRML